MKKFITKVLVTVLVFVMIVPMNVMAAEGEGAYIKAAYDMITDMYKGNLDNQTVYESIVRGMFESLDEYTEYYNLAEAEVLFNQLENSVEGIGVMLTDLSGSITIVDFLDDSPAKEAGLMIGDIIVSADDKNLTGMTSTQGVPYIKGKGGTTVKIGVKRGNSDKVLYYDIVRKNIVINPVSYNVMNDDTAYIKITTFSFDADVYFDKVMDKIDQMGIKNIILDLRNNGGGSVQAAVNVAKHFVPGGIITKLDFESESVKDTVYTNDLIENPYNLVVLVNGLTASSSELVAGAVRDTYCGVVIGERTYGKSVFQQIFPILNFEAFQICYEALGVPLINYYDLLRHGVFVPDSYIMGYVKLTVGEYLTPVGRKINDVGIRPNKVILNVKTINGVNIETLSSLYCIKSYGSGDTGSEILRSKYILKAIGYNIETKNDIADQNMAAVVKQFQSDNGLSATGILSIETQKLLNEKLTKMQQGADKQLLKAIDILND